jgi:uncharacterized protein YbjQ (UPF0145 family)
MATAEEAARFQAAAGSVLVTTGDVQAKYQPIRIVFAVGGSESGLFKNASPQEAFERTSQSLQAAAVALQAHAVVFCSFGYNAYTKSGCGGGTNFTVHGYGTAVRFV